MHSQTPSQICVRARACLGVMYLSSNVLAIQLSLSKLSRRIRILFADRARARAFLSRSYLSRRIDLFSVP